MIYEAIESKDEHDFNQKLEKYNILWKEVFRDNRNSIIEYGGNNLKIIFCFKHIPISNEDFMFINHFPKFGEILTCWRELYLYQKMEVIHKQFESKNFIPLYNSFITERNEKPYLSFLFPYIPMTLKDIMTFSSFTKFELNSLFIQLFFMGYYLSLGYIQHNDLHIRNILTNVLTEEENLIFYYQEKKYKLPNQDKIFYLIDFGVSGIEENQSVLFQEWNIFFLRLEELFGIPNFFSNTSSFSEIFKLILSFQLLEPLV